MSLLVDVKHQLGALRIDVKFENNGRLTALFGPSGSGKTSIINMIAGLTKPTSGEIIVDGVTLYDSKQRINVPAHKRRIGYVFQDARLFPHFSVQKNLDYGRWFAPRDAQISSDQLIGLLVSNFEVLNGHGMAGIAVSHRFRSERRRLTLRRLLNDSGSQISNRGSVLRNRVAQAIH